ncbi:MULTISPECIES: lysozyme inhibitor LprI family protein [Pseudoalteromonas]|uniref:lysozyme inhibitor LprI family protein n=1 Tax=Pseudoalteromonas TaxID=53246 RepID=UPI00110998F3|nr:MULTISPECIES: lysozyme inhibitor LprI family protein [Pseudoalteromonas]MCG9758369.1 lysozyme inhibitor LprI family protein [Pseudoalteromonas sp. Isolate6]NKC20212.1 DUF1311 domain-containing protein [Pseudoalteromonas galatheae]
MKGICSLRYLSAISLVAVSLNVNSASFDCGKARTHVEKMICSEDNISRLDRDLSSAYKAANKLSSTSLKQGQRDWLKNTRNKCKTTSCLEKVYKERVSMLDFISAGDDIYKSAEKLKNSLGYSLGEELLLRAAEKNDKRALYGLALLFHKKRNDIIPVLKEEASKGDMDAVFVLANKYAIGKNDKVYFAAENGSAKAVKWLIDTHYYSVDDDFKLDKKPSLAYKYYLLGKKANPDLTFYGESEIVKELAMCSEAGDLDTTSFLESRKLTREDSPWKQARLISKKSHNPRLVLQLACIGGDIPFERRQAVTESYRAFKNNKGFKFDGCIYAQGSYSMGLCAGNSSKTY